MRQELDVSVDLSGVIPVRNDLFQGPAELGLLDVSESWITCEYNVI